jgi:PAS domain S-box-containing protein
MQQWESTFDATRDAICVLDADQKILKANAAMTELVGVGAKDLIGRHCHEVVHGTAQAIADCPMRRMRTSLQRERIELQAGRRWFEVTTDPMLGTAQELQGAVHVMRDVTERKAAEASIQRLTALYAALSQCNEAIVRSTSEDELFPKICRGAVQFGGLKMAWVGVVDAQSRKVRPVAAYGEGMEFLQGIEVSVDAASLYGRGTIATALRDNRPVWCQDYQIDPMTAPWHGLAARAGWRSTAVLPLHRNGAAIGVFVLFSGEVNAFDEAVRGLLSNMALDISYALDNFFRERERSEAEAALRESDARYRELFDRNPLPLLAFDMETMRFFTVNPAAIEKYGYSREEFLAMTIVDLQVPEDRARVEATLREQYALGAPSSGMVTQRERRHITKGGQVVIAIVVAQPLRVGDRRARLISVSDVTERKRHQDELRRLNDELERRVEERTHALLVANRELEAFSYSVSHDLRAPLRAINGFAHLVEEEYAAQLGTHGKELLGRVRAGATRMGLLIEDLFKLSQISRQAIHVGPVDLSALTREVADELQAGEPERHVEWVIAPGMKSQGDAGLLKVVLQNLIGNAWKYSARRDRARIEFGAAERQGSMEYFVRDNGAGFDMAYAQKLFGAFQRLHSTTEFAGSGIGLATVARVIHRHGGEVRAEGRVNEGASVYFTLRAGRAGDPAPADPA